MQRKCILLLKKPIPDGSNKRHCISKAAVDRLLDDYCISRGWDENGIPTPKKLKEVGLF